MRNLTDIGLILIALGAVIIIVDRLTPWIIRRLS